MVIRYHYPVSCTSGAKRRRLTDSSYGRWIFFIIIIFGTSAEMGNSDNFKIKKNYKQITVIIKPGLHFRETANDVQALKKISQLWLKVRLLTNRKKQTQTT